MNVLLIDDEQISVFLTESLLQKLEFKIQVRSYLLPKLALDSLYKIKDADSLPQLILLDLNMPLMNGFDFMDILTLMGHPYSTIKVCILTSSNDKIDIDKSKMYPSIIGFITKPLLESSLLEVLKKIEFITDEQQHQ